MNTSYSGSIDNSKYEAILTRLNTSIENNRNDISANNYKNINN